MYLMREFIDALYPKVCPLCGDLLEKNIRDTGGACPRCQDEISRVGGLTCMKCGRPLLKPKESEFELENYEYCSECLKKDHLFEAAVCVFEYNDIISQSIYQFKYHGKREFAAWYAKSMYETCAKAVSMWDIDAVLPVPMYYKKERIRGYNQAALLAEVFAELMGLKYDAEISRRVRKTKAMKMLDPTQRLKNLSNAFQTSQSVVKYRHVLLVDDIYTTGATLDACTKALKEAGVSKVYGICLCIGIGI